MKFFIIFLCIFQIALTIGCNEEEKAKLAQEQKEKARIAKVADSLISVSKNLLIDKKIDSAKSILMIADSILGNAKKKPPIISEINLLIGKNQLDGFLTAMSEEEYKSLKKNKLEKDFYTIQDSLIESLVKEKLYKIRHKRPKLIAKKKREARQKEKELVKNTTVARELFAKQLQNNYYDKGMNIKVSLSGKHKTRLKLTFALIDEVWVHHFKKSGSLAELQKLHFKRVTLSDGYKFGRYWEWD